MRGNAVAFNVLAMLLVLAVTALPGVLLSFAILRGTKLNSTDKLLIGLILGWLANPVLLFLEFIILGMAFSSALVVINLFLVAAISLVVMFLQKQARANFSRIRNYFDPDYYRRSIEQRPLAVAVYAILLLLMLAGFYVRFASAWDARFFEFDPYYYDSVTEKIVLQGEAPFKSDISYYPRFRTFREFPLIHYMTAGWYALYRDFTQQQYSQDDLILAIQFYPPLMGALMVFLAFLFIREESNKYVGLIAAALFAFTPQLVKKLGAGVSEQQPFGMFAAMFIFAFFALAINRKSIRLGLLAAFAVLCSGLGSGAFVWPLMILAGYTMLISFLEYYSGEISLRDLLIYGLSALAALVSNLLFTQFRSGTVSLESITPSVLFLLFAMVPMVLLFGLAKYGIAKKLSKSGVIALLLLVLMIISVITPIAAMGLGFVNSLLRYAKSDTPLNRTIQEENATSAGLFQSSFGVLNPNTLLFVSTVLVVILAILSLRKKGVWYQAGYGSLAFALVVLNQYVDLIFSAIGQLFASSVPEVSRLFAFIVEGDVFLYLMISILSLAIYYLYEDKKNKMALLFLLAFFPTAYIGLNKVKYIVHLALAVALALPFILMILAELIERLNTAFRLVSNENALRAGVLMLIMLIGVAASYKQFETVPQSMAELQYSRITSDWNDATKWMRANLGQDYRVSSWWDYGHWTTFFGGTKTVLDPSNYYGDYDQLTARGFVHGNTTLLVDIMHYHKATHILVDSELVQKWGALVYLSGTFNGVVDDRKYDFLKQEIPSTNVPGQSEYETTHYFEYIYTVLTQKTDGTFQPTTCPGLIPKQMFYSSFGAAYCIDQTGNVFFLSSDGSQKQLDGPRLVRMDDSSVAPSSLGNNLFFNTRPTFLNLNPDLGALTDGKVESHLVDSAFVNLFFYKKLDGFELAYESPNGQVKIFKLLV